jgi:hypothetical protein
MSSEVKANKLSPSSGTALQISDSGDTTTIPSGATLNVSSATMTGFTIPSGQTLTVASGATITNSGTATGFGGDNTPSFSGTFASGTSITAATWTKLAFDTEEWDTDGAFDITTNPGRFTVPAEEGGKYVFNGGAGGFVGTGVQYMRLAIYKNGAYQTDGGHGYCIEIIPATGWDTFLTFNATMTLVATDYVELYVYQNLATGNTAPGITYFSGFKLVGV